MAEFGWRESQVRRRRSYYTDSNCNESDLYTIRYVSATFVYAPKTYIFKVASIFRDLWKNEVSNQIIRIPYKQVRDQRMRYVHPLQSFTEKLWNVDFIWTERCKWQKLGIFLHFLNCHLILTWPDIYKAQWTIALQTVNLMIFQSIIKSITDF